MVAPREILHAALKHNSASVILIHNHPSGNPIPNSGDINATHALQKTCEQLDLRLLDHYVIGANGIFSFVENGYMPS